MPSLVVYTFLGVFAVITGAYWIFVDAPDRRLKADLRKRIKADGGKSSGDRKAALLQIEKQPEVLSEIPLLDAVLSSASGVVGPIKKLLDQSGLPLTVGRFLLLSTTSALAAMMAVQYNVGIWWLSLPAGVVALFLPWTVVKIARTRRIRQFEEQFPEAIELIARALRAGHAFATGLNLASQEISDPAGAEFRLLYEKQNFGATLSDALKSFADRVPSIDARFFVTAVLTQREAGGNLSEVLDRLASVMRERFRIKREVRVKSAHGRISAFVLAGLPPTLAVMMLSSSPESIKLLVTDPFGIRIVVVAVTLQIIGTLVVRKLVDIRY